MGLLDKFDIALLMDSAYVDSSGLYRMRDRSTKGINALMGDGSAAATYPTWDSQNGRVTFDGGDYMTLRQADDSADVLANMGSIQDETYLFYFSPWVESAGNLVALLYKDDSGGSGSVVSIAKTAADEFEFTVDSGAGSEVVTTAGGEPGDYDGREMLLACVRSSAAQAIWIGTVRAASDTDASVDGSSAVDTIIGADATPANNLVATTGLRFFGYARRAITQVELRQMTRFMRGLL